MAPVPSVARTCSWYAPSAPGVQVADHSTQVSGDRGGLTFASVHVCPPSVLYSTLLTPRVPANATPEMAIAPSLMMSLFRGTSIREVVLTTALWSQPCISQYPPLSWSTRSMESSHLGPFIP